MGFAGNFSDYLEYSRQIEEEEKKNAELKAQKNKEYKQSTVPSEKKKLSFNEKKEYESILGEIEKLENEKAELEALFNSGENSADKLSGWTRRYDQLQHEIAFKIQRWEYLEDIAQK